jgi:hypothetical protein
VAAVSVDAKQFRHELSFAIFRIQGRIEEVIEFRLEGWDFARRDPLESLAHDAATGQRRWGYATDLQELAQRAVELSPDDGSEMSGDAELRHKAMQILVDRVEAVLAEAMTLAKVADDVDYRSTIDPHSLRYRISMATGEALKRASAVAHGAGRPWDHWGILDGLQLLQEQVARTDFEEALRPRRPMVPLGGEPVTEGPGPKMAAKTGAKKRARGRPSGTLKTNPADDERMARKYREARESNGLTIEEWATEAGLDEKKVRAAIDRHDKRKRPK